MIENKFSNINYFKKLLQFHNSNFIHIYHFVFASPCVSVADWFFSMLHVTTKVFSQKQQLMNESVLRHTTFWIISHAWVTFWTVSWFDEKRRWTNRFKQENLHKLNKLTLTAFGVRLQIEIKRHSKNISKYSNNTRVIVLNSRSTKYVTITGQCLIS